MKGDPAAFTTCPICGLILIGTPNHHKYNGTISTRTALRGSVANHLRWRHFELNVRERSEIADRALGALEAFA